MKSRLTITLPENLLQQVDNIVDKQTIRNRSHAIEHLIRQSLSTQVTTAIILAGGKHHGLDHSLRRQVSGAPLFSHLLQHLYQYGIKRTIICLHKDDQSLEAEFGGAAAMGMKLEYSYEAQPLGTAGALKNAQKLLTNEDPFLVIHGDILTDIHLDELCKFHLEEGSKATMVVKPKLGTREYGQVYIQGNRITTFSETGTESGISVINTGVYILNPEVLQMITVGKKTNLEEDIFPVLAKKNQLRAYFYQGFWYDISSEEQYTEAIAAWDER